MFFFYLDLVKYLGLQKACENAGTRIPPTFKIFHFVSFQYLHLLQYVKTYKTESLVKRYCSYTR